MARAPMFQIDTANQVEDSHVDLTAFESASRAILQDHQVQTGSLSIAVVDDPTIHELNRRYLEHDYATDVLSFPLESGESHLEGEVIVSLDTARRQAEQWGWTTEDELLLYVVHGVLHLVGYDDHDPTKRAEMLEQEVLYLEMMNRPAPPGRMEATSDA